MIVESVFFLFCCATLAVGAFRCQQLGSNNLVIVLLLLLGLILRVYTASDLYLHSWDERYHALVAKNMLHDPFGPTLYRTALLPYDYTNWTNNHIWLHKQPLSLWLMALSLKFFGINEYALRLPSVLFSTISIGLVYIIGKHFATAKTALLAAFFFAINGLIIEVCSGRVATDHPDTIFLFFVLLSVCFVVKFVETRKSVFNLLVGFSLGAALLTKWLPALIVLPIWLLLVWDTKQYSWKQIMAQLILIVGISMIIFLPWQLFIYSQFHQEAIWERNYNTRHFTEVLEGQNGAWYYYLNRIRIDYGELIYLPIVWAFYRCIKNKNDKKLLALVLWFTLPIIFFSCAATKMNGYLLIASPALFLVSADFFYALKETAMLSKYAWIKQLVLVLMIILPIRYNIERIKPFDTENRNPQWVLDLKNWPDRNNNKAVVFGYNAPIEAMFYTNAIVYLSIPEEEIMDSLSKEGYDVFVLKCTQLSTSEKYH